MFFRRGAMALAVLLTLLPATPSTAQARLLIFAYGDHNEAPYARIRQDRLEGGFILELGQALAQRLGREAAFRFVPRNRITAELTAGSVDAYCMAARQYYPGFAAEQFSRGLFTDDDVVILSTALTGAVGPDILTGTRIGTVLGYIYPPQIEDLFRSARAERVDARNAESNLRKLGGGRVDAVIMPRLAWQDSVAREPALARLARPEQITIATRERNCLVSPTSDLSMADLNNALLSLEEDGSLPAMRARLGLPLPITGSSLGTMVEGAPRR